MKVEITKDGTKYNIDGTPGGHCIVNRGKVVTVPLPVGKTLIDLGRAKEVSGKPKTRAKVITPSEAKQKATYTLKRKVLDGLLLLMKTVTR